jgi:hypothetical protein
MQRLSRSPNADNREEYPPEMPIEEITTMRFQDIKEETNRMD